MTLMHKAPAGFPRAPRLHFHVNLSSMLPRRPSALDPDFAVDFSHRGPEPGLKAALCGTEPVAQPGDHHCQICPTCGYRLTGHRCKLVCTQCGYYLSCADYY